MVLPNVKVCVYDLGTMVFSVKCVTNGDLSTLLVIYEYTHSLKLAKMSDIELCLVYEHLLFIYAISHFLSRQIARYVRLFSNLKHTMSVSTKASNKMYETSIQGSPVIN